MIKNKIKKCDSELQIHCDTNEQLTVEIKDLVKQYINAGKHKNGNGHSNGNGAKKKTK